MARTAKSKVAQDVEFKMAEPAAANVEPMDNPSMLRITLEMIRAMVPANWKRVCCTFAATFAAAYGASYAVVGIMNVVITAAFAATSSTFLAVFLWFIGCMLAIFAAVKAGEIIGNYVLSGQIDRDIISAKDKVLGFFKRKQVTAA